MKKKLNKKEIIISVVSLSVFAALYILFVVALFNKLETLLYIVGLLLISVLIWNMIRPLTKKGMLIILDWIEMALSFVPFIILLSIYIASLPDDSFKTVATAISASSIGGLLTLLGVAVTIKYTQASKEEDEIKKIKPCIFPISVETWSTIAKENKSTATLRINEETTELEKGTENDEAIRFEYLFIANADISMCTFFGILVNDHLIKFDYERVILKNSNIAFIIDYYFKFKEPVESVYLILEDMLHNPYIAETNFVVTENGANKNIKKILIKSVFSIELADFFE